MKKKFILPVAVGVAVFGGVTAFAATLNVTSDSLGAGNAAVNSCNAKAKATYNTVVFTTAGANKGKYVVTTAPVTTTDALDVANTNCAGMTYKVTLLDSTSAAIVEQTGTLNASGVATPDFTSTTAPVLASAVAGISVVVTS